MKCSIIIVSMIVDRCNVNSDLLMQILDWWWICWTRFGWVGGEKINRLGRLENREYGANDEDLRMRFLSVRHGWWRARRKLIRMHGLGG